MTGIPAQTTSGRQPSSLRDKIELRIACQDSVFEFCQQRRQALWAELTQEHPEWSQQQVQDRVDQMQPVYQEYDPVVQMAVVSADHRHSAELRLRAMAETAQYLRPKLKSIEVTVDPDGAEARERKAQLAARLAEFLNAGAAAKRSLVVDVTPRSVSPASPVGEEDDQSS